MFSAPPALAQQRLAADSSGAGTRARFDPTTKGATRHKHRRGRGGRNWNHIGDRFGTRGVMTESMRNLEAVLREIRLCKAPSDNEKLSALFTELDSAALHEDKFPDSFFQAIVELQRDRGFRRLDNSWTILYFLNNNWDQLTSHQREKLRGVLNEGFDKYQNWMGAFVTSEILGERYADETALETMVDLGKSARLPARAAVPHGLETLAKTTPDESLRRLAIERLRDLQESESEEVRKESLISLKKLGH